MGVYLRGSIYWVSYTTAQGVLIRRSAKTPSRAEAQALEQALRSQMGRPGDRRTPSEASFGMLLARCKLLWENSVPKSAKGYVIHGKKMLTFFGDVPLNFITLEKIEACRDSLRATTKDSTVNLAMTRLAMMFNLAVKWGLIDKSPTAALKALKVRPSRLKHLSTEEQRRLLAFLGPGLFQDLVLVALRTGMRRGELLGLKVRDVDFGRSQLALWQTKNNTPRHIPLIPDAAETLERCCAGKEPLDYVFSYRTGLRKGRPLNHFDGTWAKAMKACNLVDFRFHDLRHTFASDLVMSGAAMTAVSELLGHSTLAMTQRYTHLSPDFRKAEMDKLAAYLKK